MYKMTLHGQRVTIQAVGDKFDVSYDGKLFAELWEAEKRKNQFTWSNKEKKHDPYQLSDFGNKWDAVSKPTSREVGFSKGLEVRNKYEEDKNQSPDGDEDKEWKKKQKEKKRKERQEAEKRQNEAALTSGFDHGFNNLASYNGYEAGEKDDFRTSHSAVPEQQQPKEPEKPKEQKQVKNSDF